MSPLQEQAEATDALLDILDSDLVHDLGPKLTCLECNAFCQWLKAYGRTDAAQALLESHSLEDEEGDDTDHLKLQQKLIEDEQREPNTPTS